MVRKISKANDDKFSHYFDPATFKQFEASTSGKFSGIGVTVTETKRGLRVAQVFKGAPAEDVGIGIDDEIVGVDGKSLKGVSADAAAAQIKGPPGTSVELTVVDGQTGKRRDVEVDRANVKVPAVSGQDGGRSTVARSPTSPSPGSPAARTASSAARSSGSTRRAPRG